MHKPQRRRLPVAALVAIAMIAGACGSDGSDEATVDFDQSAATPADDATGEGSTASTSADDGTEGEAGNDTAGADGAICVGGHIGTFTGDDAGPVAVVVQPDGVLLAHFVTADTFGVSLTELPQAVSDAGLVVGEDITISPDGVRIEPAALTVTEAGVTLGTLPLELSQVGLVGTDGAVLAVADTGAIVTGRFDAATCVGSGEWTNVGLSGTWEAEPTNGVVVGGGATDSDSQPDGAAEDGAAENSAAENSAAENSAPAGELGCTPGDGQDYSLNTMPQPRFVDADLRCADFSGATLAQPRFNGADARGALFTGTTVAQGSFDNTDLRGADFTGATLTGVDLSTAILDESALAQATLIDVILP